MEPDTAFFDERFDGAQVGGFQIALPAPLFQNTRK